MCCPMCKKYIPEPFKGDRWECPFCTWIGHVHRPKETKEIKEGEKK